MEPSPKISISAVRYGAWPDKETLPEGGCECSSICVTTGFVITNLQRGMLRRSPLFSENDQWTSSSKDSARYTG